MLLAAASAWPGCADDTPRAAVDGREVRLLDGSARFAVPDAWRGFDDGHALLSSPAALDHALSFGGRSHFRSNLLASAAVPDDTCVLQLEDRLGPRSSAELRLRLYRTSARPVDLVHRLAREVHATARRLPMDDGSPGFWPTEERAALTLQLEDAWAGGRIDLTIVDSIPGCTHVYTERFELRARRFGDVTYAFTFAWSTALWPVRDAIDGVLTSFTADA